MIFIYKGLVKRYINQLTPQHIRDYAFNNNIYVTDGEVNIIYSFIMENYEKLLESGDVLVELKDKIRDDLYVIIQNLYQENKAKYLS